MFPIMSFSKHNSKKRFQTASSEANHFSLSDSVSIPERNSNNIFLKIELIFRLCSKSANKLNETDISAFSDAFNIHFTFQEL